MYEEHELIDTVEQAVTQDNPRAATLCFICAQTFLYFPRYMEQYMTKVLKKLKKNKVTPENVREFVRKETAAQRAHYIAQSQDLNSNLDRLAQKYVHCSKIYSNLAVLGLTVTGKSCCQSWVKAIVRILMLKRFLKSR
jgi:hypothetical protein